MTMPAAVRREDFDGFYLAHFENGRTGNPDLMLNVQCGREGGTG